MTEKKEGDNQDVSKHRFSGRRIAAVTAVTAVTAAGGAYLLDHDGSGDRPASTGPTPELVQPIMPNEHQAGRDQLAPKPSQTAPEKPTSSEQDD